MKVYTYPGLLVFAILVWINSPLNVQVYKKAIHLNSQLPIVASFIKESYGNNRVIMHLSEYCDTNTRSAIMELNGTGNRVLVKTIHRQTGVFVSENHFFPMDQ